MMTYFAREGLASVQQTPSFTFFSGIIRADNQQIQARNVGPRAKGWQG
jgi:hypothetical protein